MVWKETFVERLSEIRSKGLNYSTVVYDEDQRAESLFAGLVTSVLLPSAAISGFALVIFSTAAFALTGEGSLAWSWAGLGLAGVVSTGLATVASFGALFYCGLEYSIVLACVPFLALGKYTFDIYWTTQLDLPEIQQTNPRALLVNCVVNMQDYAYDHIARSKGVRKFKQLKVFIFVAQSV
jgi:hypothetical protein